VQAVLFLIRTVVWSKSRIIDKHPSKGLPSAATVADLVLSSLLKMLLLSSDRTFIAFS
jgi:hypothetical protein